MILLKKRMAEVDFEIKRGSRVTLSYVNVLTLGSEQRLTSDYRIHIDLIAFLA